MTDIMDTPGLNTPRTTVSVARRHLPGTAILAAILMASALFSTSSSGGEGGSEPLKIGIIGTGQVGSALARHWVRAGHEVFMSSLYPEELLPLEEELGVLAHSGTAREAAAFGDVLLVSVPYVAIPQIGRDYSDELAGKVVLDTSNPFERRDGPMALAAQEKGVGVASAGFLPGTRLVRAFNCILAITLSDESNREPERIAVPIGGDDPEALEIAGRLVRDAGFDPVVVGSLEQSQLFDLGEPLSSGNSTAAEIRAVMEGLRLTP